MSEESQTERPSHFIKQIIEADESSGKWGGKVVTRFPPEPNGYLHIGHAKSICLNFSMAHEFKGICHLRFDDTNPTKEEEHFANSIMEDIKWLGFDWGKNLYHASDYFEKLYDYAVTLIKKQKAYVCSLSGDQMREYRGTLTSPGKESPYRDRSVDENLKLFTEMKEGRHPEGAHVLRAKIDMGSGNINLRDPVLYRILPVAHHRTGDTWKIYPMYDYTHPISDMLEGITHSLCTLEFEDHRPLYDWVLESLECKHHPQQIEFARLAMTHILTSKRKLKALVEGGTVDGWNDPRLSTLAGMRRRGYPPAAIRVFCDRIGVAKKLSVVDFGMLEDAVRDELNETAPRVMCVTDPLKVVIENYPKDKDKVQWIEAPNHPKKPEKGKRKIPFSSEIYIEREDFMENPPKKYFRLAPGKEVRLRNSYVIRCEKVIKDDQGNVRELRCVIDPDTLGKMPEGRKVKGIVHWVSVASAQKVEVRLYDRLFCVESPEKGDLKQNLNKDSLTILRNCYLEPSAKEAASGTVFQFERKGYFCLDQKHTTADKQVFNRTVTLRDTWAKIS